VRPEGGVTGANPLKRRDLFPEPLIDGQAVRDHSLARLQRRMGSLLVSRAEREEADLERRLRAHAGVTRPNLIASLSPKGGVGKTTSGFLIGNLLASHLKLRAIAVDASPGGTLGRLAPDSAQAGASPADLLDHADRIGTAAELRRFVARLPSGLHLLAAPHDATRASRLGPDDYGELVALLSCFYETVLLDLSGVTNPLARFALERADQVVLVTTPDQLTATLAIHALDQVETTDRERTMVVVNRSHPRLAPELRAIEECLARRGARPPVTVPDDRRLATMLHTGTYSLEALDRNTRLAVKRLGLAVAERLV
jgi:MinD-like ATPase involved in chromosome partitioning or flagellar assembly